nr:hypothetical protein [Caballeronia udeis]
MASAGIQPTIPKALAAFDSMPASALVDVKVVAGLYGCSVPTIWRRAASGLLPKPEKHGGTTRWRVGDLRQALSSAA